MLFPIYQNTRYQSFKENTNTGKLKGQVFMFTGKLNNISRAEAKSLIENNGGKS